jgi:XTP/dITP diphosphohydrolase
MTTHELGGWVLASSNRGKLAEFRTLLAGTGIRLEAFADDGPEESGLSFVENALIKARHAAELSGRPALADDSGLCVAALDGEPGVRSARYAGDGASDAANVDRLLARLAGVEPHRRQAAFVCVIVALKRPDDPDPVVAAGRWPGLIAPAPLGSNGFGYDPVFLDAALGRTAAELAPGEKNAISHRSRACAELRRMLGGAVGPAP